MGQSRLGKVRRQFLCHNSQNTCTKATGLSVGSREMIFGELTSVAQVGILNVGLNRNDLGVTASFRFYLLSHSNIILMIVGRHLREPRRCAFQTISI